MDKSMKSHNLKYVICCAAEGIRLIRTVPDKTTQNGVLKVREEY